MLNLPENLRTLLSTLCSTGRRVIQRQGDAWVLDPTPNRVAGNIDWKGHEPGDVISWQGPTTRYFGLGNPAPVSSSDQVLITTPLLHSDPHECQLPLPYCSGGQARTERKSV